MKMTELIYMYTKMNLFMCINGVKKKLMRKKKSHIYCNLSSIVIVNTE